MAHQIVSSSQRVGRLGGTVSGKQQRLEFRCRRCGYGIVVTQPPADGCPMCHATGWVPTGRQMTQDAHLALSARPLGTSELVERDRV